MPQSKNPNVPAEQTPTGEFNFQTFVEVCLCSLEDRPGVCSSASCTSCCPICNFDLSLSSSGLRGSVSYACPPIASICPPHLPYHVASAYRPAAGSPVCPTLSICCSCHAEASLGDDMLIWTCRNAGPTAVKKGFSSDLLNFVCCYCGNYKCKGCITS